MTTEENAFKRVAPVAAFVAFLVIALGGICVLLVGFVGSWLGKML
jgi:nitrate reductase NapE component